MTYHERRAHADIYFLTGPFLLNHFLSLLGNGFQTVDKQFGDTGNQLHHGTHRHTEEEHLLDIQLGHGTNQGTHNHTQHQRLAEHTELLLQSFGINIELRESGNLIQQPVDANGKSRETLAERLRNADTVHIIIVALELLGSQVGHHQCNDVAHDGSEIAPCQTLIHHEIGHGTNESEMPVVPEVDIHRAGGLGNQHQEVHAQTDGDNQRTYGRVVSHGGSGRPSHVEHA